MRYYMTDRLKRENLPDDARAFAEFMDIRLDAQKRRIYGWIQFDRELTEKEQKEHRLIAGRC